MKYINNKKAFMLSTLVAMLAIGTLIFSTSATTVEQSNSEAIGDIFQKIGEMNQQMDGLETTTFDLEPYIGDIMIFAGNHTHIPQGWMACNGQLLNPNEYSTLYSILGTKYGGDGRTTFALPDFRGRMALPASDSDGKYRLGRKGKIKSKTMDHDPSILDYDIPVEGIAGYETVTFLIAVKGHFPTRD